MNQLRDLLHHLQKYDSEEHSYTSLFNEVMISPKTTLINEGEISKNIYFVKKGCLRLWYNKDGKDITFQFFFEDQAVSCLLGREPSPFSLESIEPTVLLVLKKDDFKMLIDKHPELKDGFIEILLQRLENYSKLFLARIKNNPQMRYEELLKENPQIFQRVPQHYIASYLGITPVSLSRIRNRK